MTLKKIEVKCNLESIPLNRPNSHVFGLNIYLPTKAIFLPLNLSVSTVNLINLSEGQRWSIPETSPVTTMSSLSNSWSKSSYFLAGVRRRSTEHKALLYQPDPHLTLQSSCYFPPSTPSFNNTKATVSHSPTAKMVYGFQTWDICLLRLRWQIQDSRITSSLLPLIFVLLSQFYHHTSLSML